MEDNFYHQKFWEKAFIAMQKIKAFEDYLITHGKTKNTAIQYRNILKAFFVNYMNDKPIGEITESDVNGFIPWKIQLEKERHVKKLQGRGKGRLSIVEGTLQPATINAIFTALKKFFYFNGRTDLIEKIEFAHTRKWIPRLHEIDLPKIVNLFKSKDLSELEEMTRKALKKIKRTPSNENVTEELTPESEIDEYYVKRNATLFYLLFNTGIRIGEAANLTIQSFKFDLQTPTMVVNGKTGLRAIELSPDVVEKTKNFIETEKIQGSLFCSKSGGGLKVSTLKTYIWRMFRLGLKEHYHAHTLRHAFTTFMIDNGVPVQDVSYKLGHSSIATTSVYYDIRQGKSKNPICPIDFIKQN